LNTVTIKLINPVTNLELFAVVFRHCLLMIYNAHHSIVTFLIERLSFAANMCCISLVSIQKQRVRQSEQRWHFIKRLLDILNVLL